jgi:2-dehydro-3-deoxyglucarate aldolase/4-hydroxy-2-oxoheptanedioate aldolase
MRVNQLKKTLKSGDVALGTLVWETRGRGVVHTLARAGMDFVMICTEHSAYNLETVVDLVAHTHAAGITPVVRIPDLEYQSVTRLLDSGCQSLIVPHVKTGAEVRRFVELAKYHPEGKRGMAIYLGASTEYEDVEPLTAMAHANANTLLGVLIETKEAVENVEDILLPGIDLALVGHQDLAQSLGVPGQYDHPRLREANARIQALCKERRIATAGAVTRPESMKGVIESGAQYLLYGTDLVMLRREAQRAAEALAPFRKGKTSA